MRLTLHRSGGFAGILAPPVILDTVSLSPAAARRIEGLVTSSDFFNLPRALTAPSPQPDRFQFTLTIAHDDGREHTVTCDEEVVSDPFRELVRAVQKAAKQ